MSKNLYSKLKQSKGWIKIPNSTVRIKYLGKRELVVKKRSYSFDTFMIEVDGNKYGRLYVYVEGKEVKLVGAEWLNKKTLKRNKSVVVTKPKKHATTDEFAKLILLYAAVLPKIKKRILKESADLPNLQFDNPSDDEKQGFLDRLALKIIEFMQTPKGQVITIFTAYLIPLMVILVFYWKTFALWLAEKKAQVVESQIDKEIFKGQSKHKPALEEYADLIDAIETLTTSDHLNGVLVYGRPGTGKSYVVRRTLYFNKVKHVTFKGATMTLRDVIHILYKYNSGYVIVFDDFDTILKDEDVVNILKAAADSYKKRIITFPQAQFASTQGSSSWLVPERFVFTSKVILITNKQKKDIPKALLSRFYPVRIDFTSEKIVKIIEKLIDYVAPNVERNVKLEVLSFLKDVQKKCPSLEIDFRTFEAAIDLKLAKPDRWQQAFKEIYCE